MYSGPCPLTGVNSHGFNPEFFDKIYDIDGLFFKNKRLRDTKECFRVSKAVTVDRGLRLLCWIFIVETPNLGVLLTVGRVHMKFRGQEERFSFLWL